MRRCITRLLAIGLGLALVLGSLKRPVLAETLSPADGRRQAMSRRIDELLAERWQQAGIEPAARSDDAEFLRRVYLDLTGVTASVAEVRQFLEDPSPDKRARIVDTLLNSPGYASHLAVVWRTLVLPQGFEPSQLESTIGLENWLRRQFADNLRYDNLVADFLMADGDATMGPALYYAALEVKPEKLAASSARIFLGLQLQCAECHDHPFAPWKQTDFWGYAAFFARLQQTSGTSPASFRLLDVNQGEVRLPGTEDIVLPRFPTGEEPESDAFGSRRSQLTIWMASRDNPYLARAAVNWAWSHLFGRGLVHPIDDHGANNPPSHPQLLDELSQYFVDTGFDLRNLLQTLVETEAYQLSSTWTRPAAGDAGQQPPPELFACMLAKTLSPEQLYDSIQRATGLPTDPVMMADRTFSPLRDPQRLQFLVRMQSSGRDASDYQAGLPQVLLMMHGPLMTVATDPEQSPLLRALEAPWLDDRQRIEVLLLATLGRMPTDEQQQIFMDYVESAENARKAYSDLLWSLLSSAEFALNH